MPANPERFVLDIPGNSFPADGPFREDYWTPADHEAAARVQAACERWRARERGTEEA